MKYAIAFNNCILPLPDFFIYAVFKIKKHKNFFIFPSENVQMLDPNIVISISTNFPTLFRRTLLNISMCIVRLFMLQQDDVKIKHIYSKTNVN